MTALADINPSVTSDGDLAVLATRRLSDAVVVDLQVQGNVAITLEFGSRSKADFASAIDSARHIDIVAVLDKNRVIAIVRKVDIADRGATRLRDAEHTATASSRFDAVDPDIGVVAPAGQTSVPVGEAQRAIASVCSHVVAVDETNIHVDRVLEQQTTFTAVSRDDRVDRESVNVPCLHGMASGASDSDRAHSDVLVCSLIAIKSDTNAAAEIHVNFAEDEASDAIESINVFVLAVFDKHVSVILQCTL